MYYLDNLILNTEPEPLEKILYANTGLKPDAIDLVFLTHHHAPHPLLAAHCTPAVSSSWRSTVASLAAGQSRASAGNMITGRSTPQVMGPGQSSEISSSQPRTGTGVGMRQGVAFRRVSSRRTKA